MSSTTAHERGALAGRTAVVTGASRGIGLAISLALHAEGARVVMLARDQRAMAAAIDRSRASAAITAIPVDLARADVVDAVIQSIESTLGGVPDVIVNNAAQFLIAAADQTSVADFERTIAINLTAPFALVHAFLGAMRRRGSGHIVSIGSIADHRPLRGNTAYAASKYGLRGLHEVLREELRGSGVRTTLVSPDRVDTTIWDNAVVHEWEHVKSRKEMLAPEDVAGAVLFALTRPATVNVDELRLSRS